MPSRIVGNSSLGMHLKQYADILSTYGIGSKRLAICRLTRIVLIQKVWCRIQFALDSISLILWSLIGRATKLNLQIVLHQLGVGEGNYAKSCTDGLLVKGPWVLLFRFYLYLKLRKYEIGYILLLPNSFNSSPNSLWRICSSSSGLPPARNIPLQQKHLESLVLQ
jgi:hypothetical protein